MCSCLCGSIHWLAYCVYQWPLMNETWHQSWQKVWSHQGCSFSLSLHFNLITVFDPGDVFVGFCTFRYETRQGSCANRGGDGKGRGEKGDKAGCWYEREKMQLSLSSTDQSPPRVMHAGNMAVLPACGMSLLHQGSVCTENFPFFLSPDWSLLLFLSGRLLLYTRNGLILSVQIYPPVFSLVIKSCQAEVGLHSIIPRSSHIWCSPEESRHNTHHLLSVKYVGEFCRIFTQTHSVPFINYHITKEAHLLCMVCCLGAPSNSPL